MSRAISHAPIHEAPLTRGSAPGDLMAIAWNGRWTILGAVMAGLTLGGAAVLAWPREFTATALLMPLAADDAAMRTELSIWRGAEVTRGTVERVGAARIVADFHKPAPLEWLAPACDAASHGLAVPCALWLMKSHLLTRLDGERDGAGSGRVVRLIASHPDPAVAIAMAEAAISADWDARRAAFATSRAETLAPRLDAAETDAAGIAAQIARIQADAGVPDIARGIDDIAAEAGAIAHRDGEARERQAAAAAELAATRQSLAASPERVLDTHEVSNADAGEDARAQLLRLRLERAHMTPHYNRDYPGLVELDGKIATIETTLRAQPRSTASLTRDIRNPAFVQLAAQAAQLEAKSRALAGQREELGRQSERLAARADALREPETRLAALRRRQSVREATIRQLSATMTDLDARDALAAARVEGMRLLQPPLLGAPTSPAAATDLAGGLLAGLVGGLAATFIAARRRPFRIAARQAGRHLEPPEPAGIALLRVLDGADAAGHPIAIIHLVTEAATGGPFDLVLTEEISPSA